MIRILCLNTIQFINIVYKFIKTYHHKYHTINQVKRVSFIQLELNISSWKPKMVLKKSVEKNLSIILWKNHCIRIFRAITQAPTSLIIYTLFQMKYVKYCVYYHKKKRYIIAIKSYIYIFFYYDFIEFAKRYFIPYYMGN